jgi:putative endonuclease
MLYKVYILECADKTLYTGCTNRLGRRVLEHNVSVRGAKYTHSRRPVKLIYYETFATLGQALRREREIKSWRRWQKLKLVKSK